MDTRHRQTLSLIQSQRARNLHPLMESKRWEQVEQPPTPPPKDARFTTTSNTAAMDGDIGSAPASGSKRKRSEQDVDNIIYERRNGQLEAINGDQDLPTVQKRPRSHAGNSSYSDDDAGRARYPAQGSLRRKQGFGNLSNINLRHAAASAFRSESPSRESRFQEGSLSDKPSQQPPSVFTRVARTDSGSLQQVDELMNDYHDAIAASRESTEEYEKATIEYEKATIPARVAGITEQRKEEGKRGMFRFGKSFTNTFHPVQLWNRMWSESREELMAKNRMEAERKAREKADIQARYDQMKRDGQFNMQQVPFAGTSNTAATPIQDTVMINDGYETSTHQRVESVEISRPQGGASRVASSDARKSLEDREANEAIPTTATRSRFARLHFKTPSISNLKDTFRSVRSVRSHSALSGAVDGYSSASASVSPDKADLSTLKKSISRYDLKKERRLSNRVSDLESKLNKARMELKNALDEASPMPKLGSSYERFTPIGTTKRSRFVPGALATLPSERLMFPDMNASSADGEQQHQFLTSEVRPGNTLELNNGMDMSKAFENIYDEDELQEETTIKSRRDEFPIRGSSMPRPSDVVTQPAEVGIQPTDLEGVDTAGPSKLEVKEVITNDAGNSALYAKLSVLEASYKAANKPAKSKKRKSGAAVDEKSYCPIGEAEESSAEEMVAPKKRKPTGKTAGVAKKKSPAEKAAKKTGIPGPAADANSKGKKTKKVANTAENFFTNGNVNDEDDATSSDELAPAVPAGPDSDAPSLEPVYEEEEEVTTIPLKDVPSKPTAKSTPARYGYDKLHSHSNSPHKKRSDSLLPAVNGGLNHRHRSSGRSPPPKQRTGEVVEETIVAVPGKNGVPSMPVGDKNWTWPEDVF